MMGGFGSQGEPSYLVLTADLAGSRRVADRAALQDRLQSVLAELNRSHQAALAAPLAISRGDEIQGLLGEPAVALALILGLSERLHPLELRFGLGVGSLTTRLRPEVGQLDGPAFHHARTAVERAAADGLWVATAGFGEPQEAILDTIFALMQALRRRWTDRQREYVHAAREALQKDVAREFGVSPSTVSESLQAAAYATVIQAERLTVRLLKEFGQGTEVRRDSGSEPKDPAGGEGA